MSSLSLKVLKLVDTGYFNATEATVILKAINTTPAIPVTKIKKPEYLKIETLLPTLPTYFEDMNKQNCYI